MDRPAEMNNKPTIIGIYGVPGSGKTSLLRLLETELPGGSFSFYEGSTVIDKVSPGGLAAFKKMELPDKEICRQEAMKLIKDECVASGRIGIVTGHYMFWDVPTQDAEIAITSVDLKTYTHVVYLNQPAFVVSQRREHDTERHRDSLAIPHLREWIDTEVSEMTTLCLNHSIMFTLLLPYSIGKIAALIQDFVRHNEHYNQTVADERIDNALASHQTYLEKVLVFDADRTLAPIDTGKQFWKQTPGRKWSVLKGVFGSQLGYSYSSFRQAALLYEQDADDVEYDGICDQVAAEVNLYPEIANLLHCASAKEHIGIVVVTCGLRLVWEKVLEREGLSDTVKVIGGGRISDGYVVTPRVKGALVRRLRDRHGLKVWAFGDSPVDIEMLRGADYATVIVGDENNRSRTMDAALITAIEQGLQAHQVLLPESAPPRLDTIVLPAIKLDDPTFLQPLLASNFHLVHATSKPAAKLLQTPMRDAQVVGPALRKVHKRAGLYLAIEHLSEVIGLEEYNIAHVQGNMTTGHQLADEARTIIIALMRGGLPMADGINKAFKKASMLHAFKAEDIKARHVLGKSTVLLVDSVINNGTTVIEFVNHIRALNKDIRIVVVAGVVQAKAVAPDGPLRRIARNGTLTVVALRLSENKYKGTRGTDTGNRLFNTVNLD
ncbi:hypothetical protein BO94DRAFT_612593 [Aspergillus sclerotioniger CBS 115572]|uniref:Phosphoribosyltransferase domain-containing protein n=1 Tax=Aspergillus sclerotioniger CBS 115572 TaxID=1450535 RepID=A0A317X8N7_9EURO|nr:hypothetical protein BO94DRAFT_612593 [Aspergillus sclerotioniger CBS 115572]PWY93947.1 hypothetical protein BO94DRAFT_612593 [Aspergillus sclerotioniger CBS 115572]